MKTPIFCFLIFFLVSCSQTNTELLEPIAPGVAYGNILEGFDSASPGKGVDVFNDESRDRPMAYGLILSAEANRFKATEEVEAKQNALACLDWLMNNADKNENGIHGYGLADSWDAFTDGSVNPAHHEYTITTALAVKGMIDWLEIEEDSAFRSQIMNTIEDCFSPFADETFYSSISIPGYSIGEEDLSYNVFNPAVFLAGEMQRYSQLHESSEMASVLESKASQIISITEQHALTDPDGNYYWNYGVEVERPNDLVHACYVIEGFRTYRDFGGTLSLEFSKIENHLQQFNDELVWVEHPKFREVNNSKSPRLWALGMAIYTLTESGKQDLVEGSLFKQLGDYRREDGTFRFREEDDRKMVRQSAHLLLGLSAFLYGV
jgi:hypothetical protein